MFDVLRNDSPTWFERYRPTTLDQCVLTVRIRSQLDTIIRKRAIPNLLAIGPPGVGKTATMKCVLETLSRDFGYQMIRASDQHSPISLRDALSMTAGRVLFNERMVLFIDELDELVPKHQKSIRPAIDAALNSWSYVATANVASKIDPALKSRFRVMDFSPPLSFSQKLDPYATEVTDRISFILRAEGKVFDRSDVEQHVQDFGTNIRDCINELQAQYDC